MCGEVSHDEENNIYKVTEYFIKLINKYYFSHNVVQRRKHLYILYAPFRFRRRFFFDRPAVPLTPSRATAAAQTRVSAAMIVLSVRKAAASAVGDDGGREDDAEPPPSPLLPLSGTSSVSASATQFTAAWRIRASVTGSIASGCLKSSACNGEADAVIDDAEASASSDSTRLGSNNHNYKLIIIIYYYSILK